MPGRAKIEFPGIVTRFTRPQKAREMQERIERLKIPQIRTMSPQRVLVAEATGTVPIVVPRAFGALISTYYSVTHRRTRTFIPAPRARYEIENFEDLSPTGRRELPAQFALPVPDSVRELSPAVRTVRGFAVKLDTWEYGAVAEVLAVGSYADRFAATLRDLVAFVRGQGYSIVGNVMEQEYHVGPGRFLKGNPQEYTTLFRLMVEPK